MNTAQQWLNRKLDKATANMSLELDNPPDLFIEHKVVNGLDIYQLMEVQDDGHIHPSDHMTLGMTFEQMQKFVEGMAFFATLV